MSIHDEDLHEDVRELVAAVDKTLKQASQRGLSEEEGKAFIDGLVEEFKAIVAELIEKSYWLQNSPVLAVDVPVPEPVEVLEEERIMCIVANQQERLNHVAPAVAHFGAPEAEAGEVRSGVPVYTEVPAGMSSIPDACAEYGLSQATIRSWVSRGHIRVEGELRGGARGRRPNLVDKTKLEEFINSPRRKGGRPRKTGDQAPTQ